MPRCGEARSDGRRLPVARGGGGERQSGAARSLACVCVGGICAKYCVCGGVRALLGFAMIYITACQKASRGLAY